MIDWQPPRKRRDLPGRILCGLGLAALFALLASGAADAVHAILAALGG